MSFGRSVPYPRGAIIKSIQEITGKVTSTNNTLDVTITAVDPDNTELIYQLGGGTPVDTDANAGCVRVGITSSTNIRFTREYVTSGDSTTIHVKVIEYFPGIIKKQTGTIALTSVTTNTATITAVNTAKAYATYLGCSSDDNDGASTQDIWEYMASVDLTNSTTVTATITTADSDTITVAYQVIEFIV